MQKPGASRAFCCGRAREPLPGWCVVLDARLLKAREGHGMARKLIAFHDEDRRALEQLAEDTTSTFQELMDEAVRDLLKKHGRPTGLREALTASGKDNVVRLQRSSGRKTR
jgi:hypothetical protein